MGEEVMPFFSCGLARTKDARIGLSPDRLREHEMLFSPTANATSDTPPLTMEGKYHLALSPNHFTHVRAPFPP